MKEIIWDKSKKIIQNQKNQKLMKEIRYKMQNHLKRINSQQNRDNADLVDTYIELETHVVKNIELSTSRLVARKITETPDENFDTEEEISFDYQTIPGDYSDYGIFEE